MSTKIFVNLPVKDLQKTMTFWKSLVYSFNKQFTDDKAACLVIAEDIYVMFLVEVFFKTFIKKEIADASKVTESIIALSSESREKVDELIEKAYKAGGISYIEPQEMGFMYSRSFQDIDGHLWEILWMDPKHVDK
ncbi:MAG: glyoxalase [Candidatus Pacebacteria bacterium]|nr:glyoxalase [Candidatus Paceibacterota bacterium]